MEMKRYVLIFFNIHVDDYDKREIISTKEDSSYERSDIDFN
jgi:hypothetical protein